MTACNTSLGFTYDNKPAGVETSKPVGSATKPKKSTKTAKKSRATDNDEEEDASLEGAVGSVAGGGRYDNLVNLFNPSSPKVPCVGVSFGIERLLTISEILEKRRAAAGDASGARRVRATETDVMVVVAHNDLIIPRLEVAQELWNANIKARLK